MATHHTSEMHDDPKIAVSFYILHLQESYVGWYSRAVFRWQTAGWLLRLGVIACGLFPIIAGIVTNQLGGDWAWVYFLPPLGGFVAGLYGDSRLRDHWQLRERGRIAFQDLITYGRLRYAAAHTAADFTALHDDLRQRADAIERSQAARHFELFSIAPPSATSGTNRPD
jgi:hypothetical protein